MLKQLRFYKENEKWYLDFLDFIGNKEDLQPIFVADNLLSFFSSGKDEIIFQVSDSAENLLQYVLENPKKLGFTKGIFYETLSPFSSSYTEVYVCSAFLHVFGYFPDKIWYEPE